LLTGK
jgi:hypothetical protein